MDNEQRLNDAARCLKYVGKKLGYSAIMRPLLRCMVGHKYSCSAFSHLHYKRSLCVCVCVIGATSESQKSDLCTKTIYE